jgi:hypothetical protein
VAVVFLRAKKTAGQSMPDRFLPVAFLLITLSQELPEPPEPGQV